MSDQELFQRVRAGDESAYEMLFRHWYPSLVRHAERMVRERSVAEELAQEVFLELWLRRETLAANGSPKAYLFQSIHNRALNHLRHLKVEKRAEPYLASESSAAPTAPARLMIDEMERAVWRAVQELPDRCREVFELSRIHGLSYAEIATTLGVSKKAVEFHMGRAFRALRKDLAAWLPKGDTL